MKNKQEETAIRELINQRVEAIKNKDIQGASKNYADDVLVFDVVGPLQHTEPGSVAKRLQEWFSTFKDDKKPRYEIVNLKITAADDVAFCTGLNHVSAILKNGNKLNMYWRETLNWEKINGQWMITSAHSSVPFDATNGMASTGLKP